MLFVKIVLPKVAFKASGVGTLELVSMSFDASAAVTLIEIMLSSCSGVVDFDLFFDVFFLDAVGFDFFGAIFFEPRSLPLSIPTGHNMSSSLESNEGPRK